MMSNKSSLEGNPNYLSHYCIKQRLFSVVISFLEVLYFILLLSAIFSFTGYLRMTSSDVTCENEVTNDNPTPDVMKSDVITMDINAYFSQ